ncbi:MAG: hypothetical protein R3F17_05610 [Planctomycetota bacterium]
MPSPRRRTWWTALGWSSLLHAAVLVGLPLALGLHWLKARPPKGQRPLPVTLRFEPVYAAEAEPEPVPAPPIEMPEVDLLPDPDPIEPEFEPAADFPRSPR